MNRGDTPQSRPAPAGAVLLVPDSKGEMVAARRMTGAIASLTCSSLMD